jgi:hypothetical protein
MKIVFFLLGVLLASVSALCVESSFTYQPKLVRIEVKKEFVIMEYVCENTIWTSVEDRFAPGGREQQTPCETV